MSGGKGNSKSNTSASTSTSTSQETINTVDNRAVQGDNAVIGGNVTVNSGEASQVDVTMTDLGAIKGGIDLALESLGFASVVNNSALDSAGRANESVKSVASDSIRQAYDLAQEARQSETSGAINNLTKYVMWIALAGIVAWAVVKSKK